MPAHFLNVAPVTGNTAWLNALLREARASVRRFGWFSDSRCTSPGGAGIYLYTALARAVYARYGNYPESAVNAFAYHDGAFLSSGHNVDGMTGIVPVALNTIPPAFYPVKVIPGGLGAISAFHYRNNSQGGYGYKSNLFNWPIVGIAGRTVRARLFGITEPGTSELSAIYFPQASSQAYYAPSVLTGVGAMGVNAMLGQIKQQTFLPAFAGADDTLNVLTCWPTIGAGSSNITGVRWENPDAPYGVAFQPLSAGGYQTTSFIAAHSQCGPTLNAIGLHAGIILFGANDYGNGATAAQKRDNTIAMIRAVRATMGNPTFPFILFSDLYRTGLVGSQPTEWAQDAGAMAEVAASEPFCVALNLQRAAYQSGWNADNNAWALSDGVHWTEAGTYAVASLATDLMFSDTAGDFTTADRDTLAYIATQATKINALSTAEPDPDSFSQFDVPLVAETDVRFSQPITIPGRDITGWTALAFTVKRSPASDLDSDALVTIRISNPANAGTDGILLHRGRPVDPADPLRTAGIVTVASVTPDAVLTPTITAAGMDIPPNPENEPYTYEIDVWRTATAGDKEQIGKAEFAVAQSVRRSPVAP